MKTPMVDHFWTKIAERGSLALGAARDKLAQVQQISEVIKTAEGSDVLRNVMANDSIRLSLQRCVEFHEGDSTTSEAEMHIYYSYATFTAKNSEQIIDSELAYLNL